MRLEDFDLNLLVVFDAIGRERSVTKAAGALGLSQPAVSHALTRLRWLLKDRLFVRSTHGMVPTPRASEIAASVHGAIAQLRSAVEFEAFDPALSRQTFSIAMSNFAAIVIAAPLAAACAEKAPYVRLVMRPSGTLDTDALLDRGLLDLAIGDMNGRRSRGEPLLQDRYVAVMRRGHPNADGPLPASTYARAAHLRISSTDEDVRFVDRELASRRLSRTIDLEAPYLSAGGILASSDLIAVVARRIAVELCDVRPLTWRDLPFPSPPLCVGVMWPEIYKGKASHAWLRTVVAGVAMEAGSCRLLAGPSE